MPTDLSHRRQPEDSKAGSGRPIYLDYNATTPHDPEVIAAMRPYLEEQFGNPSSSHWYGVQTRKAVEEARGQVAALLDWLYAPKGVGALYVRKGKLAKSTSWPATWNPGTNAAC